MLTWWYCCCCCCCLPSPLAHPLGRGMRMGALCRSAFSRLLMLPVSFCMELSASLTEFTTFTMFTWLSDSSCNGKKGKPTATSVRVKYLRTRCAALRCVALRCVALRCAQLRCVAFMSKCVGEVYVGLYMCTICHMELCVCVVLGWVWHRCEIHCQGSSCLCNPGTADVEVFDVRRHVCVCVCVYVCISTRVHVCNLPLGVSTLGITVQTPVHPKRPQEEGRYKMAEKRKQIVP